MTKAAASNFPLPHTEGAYDALLENLGGKPAKRGNQARFRDLQLETDKSGMALGGSVVDRGVRRPLHEHEIIAIAVAHIDAVHAAMASEATKVLPRPQPEAPAQINVRGPARANATVSEEQRLVDAHCDAMGRLATAERPVEYGTEVEIQALAEALQMEVIVLVEGKGKEANESQGPGLPMRELRYRPAAAQGPLPQAALLYQLHGWEARNENHYCPLALTDDELMDPSLVDLPTAQERAGEVRGDGDCLFSSLGRQLDKTPTELRALAVQWLRSHAAKSPAIQIDLVTRQMSAKATSSL